MGIAYRRDNVVIALVELSKTSFVRGRRRIVAMARADTRYCRNGWQRVLGDGRLGSPISGGDGDGMAVGFHHFISLKLEDIVQ